MTSEQTSLVSILLSLFTIAGTVWVGWYATHTGKRSNDQVGAVALRGQDLARIGELEAQVAKLWAAREADAVIKRAAGDHIDLLENHIWKQLPPPPPPRPAGV